ncbi:hypothetical protein [Streptomyces specialis]|uniref:hypothetical protein n=1 Tax=Streptomyces specialis TaxID=498367 RepID=UPI00073E5453|nr:hypothetical protein [Streptomyces specialis]
MSALKKMFARTAASSLAAAALVGAGVAVASPAQATVYQCQQYLESKGYTVGPKATAACDAASEDEWWDEQLFCATELMKLGVNGDHAREACRRAAL